MPLAAWVVPPLSPADPPAGGNASRGRAALGQRVAKTGNLAGRWATPKIDLVWRAAGAGTEVAPLRTKVSVALGLLKLSGERPVSMPSHDLGQDWAGHSDRRRSPGAVGSRANRNGSITRCDFDGGSLHRFSIPWQRTPQPNAAVWNRNAQDRGGARLTHLPWPPARWQVDWPQLPCQHRQESESRQSD